METSVNGELLRIYDQIRRLQDDVTNLAKEFYETSAVSYDEISGTPETLSSFENDMNYISSEEVDQKIESIPPIDDSNYLKKKDEDSQECTILTHFKDITATTQKKNDCSDNVATTQFVHSLIEESSKSTEKYISGIYSRQDAVSSAQMKEAIKKALKDYYDSGEVDSKIEQIISELYIPTKTSDLRNDSGFITIDDIPQSPVTSVNGQTGDVTIQIPTVPTNISSFTNDVGYITDPGVTSVNNQTGAVYVQENVQANWSSTSGLSAILNKPALKRVATTGSYNDLDDKPTIPTNTSELTNDSGFLTQHQDISGKANIEDLASVAFSGSYEDLNNSPVIPENKIFYGTCNTAAGTAAKVVVCNDFTSSDLTEGTIILVKFSATNSGAVGSLTLNVNSTGAKKIQYINNGTLGNLSNAGYIKASTTYMFVFDGTHWLFLHNYNSNTTYTAMTQANANAGTETTARTITAAVLKNAIKTHAQVHDVTVDGVSVLNGTTAEIVMPTIPTNVSDLNNDSGFISSYTETDPTVPAWAKAANKPTYTASEVGAATLADVQSEIAALVNSAPTTLDTLSELANALGDDPNFATTVSTQIGTKYTKPSTGIPYSDLNASIQSSLDKADTALQSFTETDPTVPSWAKAQNKPTYTAAEVGALPDTTVLFSGDYNDLSNKPTIPSLSGYATETWVGQQGYLTQHQDISGKANTADLATVATSGSYNDLSDKPTIPTVPINISSFTNDSGYLTSYTETDPTVPSWAKAQSKPTYDYSEITNTPNIPTVPTNLSSFTDDLGSSPTHTHSQYLTSAPVTSVNGQTGAVSLSIPTVPSNIVTGTSSSYTIWAGTQAQYEAITTKDATTIYLITES